MLQQSTNKMNEMVEPTYLSWQRVFLINLSVVLLFVKVLVIGITGGWQTNHLRPNNLTNTEDAVVVVGITTIWKFGSQPH